MKKSFNYVIILLFLLGLITLGISGYLDQSNNISDFILGFLEGMSATFILIGLFYICYCFIKKKNPFSFDK